MRKSVAALLVLAVMAAAADARSIKVRRDFQREHPCPSTGKTRGACPGWQADHVIPLCAGGVDAPENMQWLTVEAHKAKTREDLRVCRSLKP